MSADRRRRRALSENELLSVYVVLGAGVGLPATAAAMVGHDDGGYLIATVYTKLAERRAIARAQRAMDAYQRRDAANAEPPRLKVVREAG
jgi:hypothetical protein